MHHAIKTYTAMEVQPHTLLISAVQRAFSFTICSLYPRGKCSWYPLERKAGGLQSRSGNSREKKNSFCPYMKSNAGDDSVGQHYTVRGLPATGHNSTASITAEGSKGSQGTGVDWQHIIVAGNSLWRDLVCAVCDTACGLVHGTATFSILKNILGTKYNK